MRAYCLAQDTLLNVVWWPKWEGTPTGREYVYTYSWCKPVYPKGNQSWIFIERTDAEFETPILWPPDAKNWLTGEDPDTGKDWTQKEKGTTENEMVGWHHWLHRHEFEQAPGGGDGQGSLHAAVHEIAELDMSERLNW